jgi:UDP-N-acetylmuramate dehydrogenase
MNWLNDFKGRVETGARLADRTHYCLGGPARWMVSPKDADALADVIRRASAQGVATKVLGAGANVLVRDDGFDGVVIRLDEDYFTATSVDGDRVRAGGGADLMALAHTCSKLGLSGLERLAGIPATVGGAIRMNAGGKHGEIADVVERVTLIGPDGVDELANSEIGFGYRSSDVGDRIVASATLQLEHADADVTLERYRSIFREKTRTQPFTFSSAGCVFKNPGGQSAGALIDQAGLKGARHGGAYISDRHANFILAGPGATSADVLHLIDRAREAVSSAFGIDLELEIDVW